jgi:preprotein translocase subunit SecF
MHWFSSTPNFNFMRYRWVALWVSAILCLVSLGSMLIKGLNYGIEFTGGVVVEATYSGPADLEQIRSDLTAAGFETAQVQNYGSTADVLIRLPPAEETLDAAAVQNQILGILRAHDANVSVKRFETVGPQVGEDLADQGGLAMLFAMIMIFVYVMVRFRWKLAVGAIVASIHDVLITVGVFSLLGWQFDLTVLGSVLAVLGYSLNDTIVVYDRIRDNFRLMRRGTPEAIVNASINQTLARTLVTGVTTLLVLVALMLLAGETLWGFSVALIIGIVVGTYSSIYIASAMALLMKVGQSDFVVARQQQVDDLP